MSSSTIALCNTTEVKSVEKVFSVINECLDAFDDYDFVFEEETFSWKGKYIQGSTSCDLNINVYLVDGSVIVECKRISGECSPFHSFYKDFKAFLTDVKCDDGHQQHSVNFSTAPHVSCCERSKNLSFKHFMQSIEPLFVMAYSELVDCQKEGAKMLCDLTNEPHHICYLQNVDCISRVLGALQHIILTSASLDAIDHSIIALANVCEIPGYQAGILALYHKSKATGRRRHLLAMLFRLVSSPDSAVWKQSLVETESVPEYQRAQVRREAGRILGWLTVYDAAEVVRTLHHCGEFDLSLWVDEVPRIQDNRLRCYAEKIRDRVVAVHQAI